MNIALISVRGGSVRLPRKNILPMCGHPLLAWTVTQAFYSKEIDFVLFTTDDQEMYWTFEKYVPKENKKPFHMHLRPVYDNNTSVGRPYLEVVRDIGIKKYNFKDDDVLVSLFATSPQRHPHDIDNLVRAFKNSKYEEMAFYAPDRECHVFKNSREMSHQYGQVFEVEPVISNKFWDYSIGATGTSISTVGHTVPIWEEQGEKCGWSDRYLDEQMKDLKKKGDELKERKAGAYSVYPYQAFECDYHHWFKVVENIMEEYILKGRGIGLYRDYFEGHI